MLKPVALFFETPNCHQITWKVRIGVEQLRVCRILIPYTKVRELCSSRMGHEFAGCEKRQKEFDAIRSVALIDRSLENAKNHLRAYFPWVLVWIMDTFRKMTKNM